MKWDKETDRLAKQFVGLVVRSLINEGIIDPKDKTGTQLLKEAEDYVSNLKDEDWVFIIDHTGGLLKQARLYYKEDNKELACLFYALYIEHQLNSFIVTLAKRKNLSTKDIESLIRDSSYRAKCSWLLRIFDVKAIDAVHTNRIVKLMELRNSYVHYKWKPENEQMSQELESILNFIE
jgi:HEPN domain-containing protein